MGTGKILGWCWVPVLLFVVCGCASNPVTGQREFVMISESQEIAMGREADVQIREQMGLYDDEELQRYVERIGLEMASRSHRPDLPWSFAVVDSPVVNAFAVPGGFIYLTRGIMAYLDDESDLAGVLGHEIGHVTARHSVQAMTRAGGAQLGLAIGGIVSPTARSLGGLAEIGLGVLFLRYGRDAELQSDRLGAEYAVASGWDPNGVRDMLTTLSRLSEGSGRGVPSWMSTHPEAADRVVLVGPTLSELEATTSFDGLRVNRRRYLDQVDGIVFGDNPEQGVVRGNDFLHPVLRFAVRFPEGWEITNMPTQVVAQPSSAEVSMVLRQVSAPETRDLERLAVDDMRESGFQLGSSDYTIIGGFDAFLGSFKGETDDGEQASIRLAYIDHGGTVYALGGIAQSEAYGRVESEFNRTIRSFRRLNAAQAEGIRPNRIRIYTVREGDSWQSIAQNAAKSLVPADTLAFMNGFFVDEQPLSGDLIKVVAEG